VNSFGGETELDVAAYQYSGGAKRSLRQPIERARRAGVFVQEVTDTLVLAHGNNGSCGGTDSASGGDSRCRGNDCSDATCCCCHDGGDGGGGGVCGGGSSGRYGNYRSCGTEGMARGRATCGACECKAAARAMLAETLRDVSNDWLSGRSCSAATTRFINRRPAFEEELPGVRIFVAWQSKPQTGSKTKSAAASAAAAGAAAGAAHVVAHGGAGAVGCADAGLADADGTGKTAPTLLAAHPPYRTCAGFCVLDPMYRDGQLVGM